jgi:hypothetical protein
MNKVIAKNKPLVSAVIGGIVIKMATSDLGSSIRIGGYSIPTWALGALLGFGGSVGTDMVSQTVLPHIPQSAKLQKLESIVLHIVTSGALFAFVPKILVSDLSSSEMKKLAVGGVVTELASQFIHEMSCARDKEVCMNDDSLFM